jgi:tetratricopeptide (TPR) repeat protein
LRCAYPGYDGAIKDFNYARNRLQKRLQNQPSNNKDLNLLGRALMFLGKYKEAENTLKRSLRVSSVQQQPYAYNGLGELYALQRLDKAAIEQWQKALEINPHYLVVQNNLRKIQG